MEITEEIYGLIAAKLFKSKEIAAAVYDHEFRGVSYYKAEKDHNVKSNTLTRYCSKYKKESAYIISIIESAR